MDTQENKTENSENKEVDFKFDFRKIICDNKILVVVILSFMAVIAELYLIADDKSYNNFGDYFGGVLNPLLAFISFIAILRTVALQRHSIKLQQDELRKRTEEFEKQTKIFNQQQFETTFFSLVRLMSEKQSISGRHYKPSGEPEPDYNIIYGLLKETVEIIENYRQQCLLNLHSEEEIDNFENEIAHYVNILKLQIKNDALNDLILKIIDNEKLKKYCEKYRFFEFIENIRVNEDILLKYKLSAFGDNIHYQREVSQSEYATGDFLDKLLETTKYDEVKVNIANNPNATKNALKILSKNEEKKVRQAVASNGNTPQDTLKQLANDNEKEKEVRQAVANNKITPEDTLKYLSNDKEYCVRLSVMNNPKIETKLKEELLNEENYNNEFCSIALNDKNLSESCLIEILNKTDLTHIEKIMQQNNINEKVFEKIIEIFEKCNAIQIEDMIIFAKLLLLDKLYQYENVLKKLIYLYIDKCNFERNIYINSTKCEYLYDYLKHFDSKNSFAIINVALDYIDEKSIDSQRLQKIIENLGFFIGSAKYPDNRDLTDDMKKEIDEKINGIKKLDDTQKQKLINCFN